MTRQEIADATEQTESGLPWNNQDVVMRRGVGLAAAWLFERLMSAGVSRAQLVQAAEQTHEWGCECPDSDVVGGAALDAAEVVKIVWQQLK
jgi:hypothetical protein